MKQFNKSTPREMSTTYHLSYVIAKCHINLDFSTYWDFPRTSHAHLLVHLSTSSIIKAHSHNESVNTSTPPFLQKQGTTKEGGERDKQDKNSDIQNPECRKVPWGCGVRTWTDLSGREKTSWFKIGHQVVVVANNNETRRKGGDGDLLTVNEQLTLGWN